MLIFPSIISCDILNLERTIRQIDDHIDGYHIDIMDDHFVPNLTWGPMFVNALRRITQKPFQLHLMVTDPSKWIHRVERNSGDSFIFHYEALENPDSMSLITDEAADHGWRVGLAINPATPVEKIYPHMQNLNDYLFMSVNPGFSGQSFIDITSKIIEFRDYFQAMYPEQATLSPISVDGGVGASNIGMLARAGVTRVGVASAIFAAGDPIENIAELRRLAAQELSVAK